MTLDPTMLSLMEDTVTIEPFVSANSAQAASYGAPVTYQALVVVGVERIIGRDGREVTSTAQVVIPDRLAIDPRSRITLPAGFNPNQPPILKISGAKGLSLDHSKIWL